MVLIMFVGVFCEDFQVPPADSRFLDTTTSGRVRFGEEVQYDCRGYETLMSDHSANHVTYTCLDSPDGVYDPAFDSSTWDTCALSEYLLTSFYLFSRCLMVSTNQADPGCFYFRIS